MEKHTPSLDDLFHALADPTRRAVVQRLGQGPSAVSVLAAPHDMALPSFMKHLGILEGAGLICSEKSGRVRTCSLHPESLTAAERWFEEQHALWGGRFDNLDNLLDTLRRG
jgi:DNA-binding transcriptional ArsR family regulator